MSAFGTPLDIVDYDMSKPAQTARIQVRLRPEVLALVKRAAAIQGQSVNAFVAGAAEEGNRERETGSPSLGGGSAPYR
jgi:Protein of unknown function (DUF1778)